MLKPIVMKKNMFLRYPECTETLNGLDKELHGSSLRWCGTNKNEHNAVTEQIVNNISEPSVSQIFKENILREVCDELRVLRDNYLISPRHKTLMLVYYHFYVSMLYRPD